MANIIGLIVTQLVLAYVLTALFGDTADETTPSLALQVSVAPAFALGGAIAGFGQWLVLRRLFHRAGWWILATAGGWMAGFLWTFLLIPQGGDSTSVLAAIGIWLLIGLFSGLCQWLVLRHHYERSALWVPVATVAMTVGTTGWLGGGTFVGGLLLLASGALGGWTLMRVLPPKSP